ncbi:Glutamine-rich protein 2 [Trachymyrmex septentrionalis]|uniref:Glutamine-rich protein 2 n=1 Tax=Trachymyrmex septentrionalis TaxID=34720 RepID=A0A195EUN5_9HYME|nr:Glutamine-rich protein 2 [Trachymyrmex septentrionalis]
MAAKTANQMPEAFNVPTAANANNNASLQISLSQMLDLALGAPEVGAVNFNILHNFLHIMLQQINLQAATVTFHGENADQVKRMISSMKPRPEVMRVRRDDGEDADVLTEDIQVPTETILRVTEDVTPQIDFEKVPEAQMVVSVDNNFSLLASQFKELEKSVKQIQDRYQALEDLARSPEIEELKDRIADPTADIWQFVNINKRLDTNEQGIDKLTAMVQDVIKGDVGVVTADTSLINTRLDELEDKVFKMEQWLTNLQAVVDMLAEEVPEPTTDITEVEEEVEAAIVPPTDITAVKEGEEEVEAAIAAAAEPVETNNMIEHEIEENAKIPKVRRITAEKLAARAVLMSNNLLTDEEIYILDDNIIEEIRQDITALKTDVVLIQQELQDLNERIAQKEKITDVTNLEQCLEAVKNVETTHGEALNNVTQRVILLESDFRNLLEKVNIIQEVDKTDSADVNTLITQVQKIETDMETIGQTMNKLLEDKEKKEAHINTLLEQIEVLKTVKANKEDIEDALADKADAHAMKRKVSHEQFDAACDDLARGLEEAIDKLSKQESIWQQALDEVQNEIATKLDKAEMVPLKDFVDDKLKSLHEKLKIMIEARREIEAAGTKKLLTDVQCISCDKDVVMRTEEVGKFRTEPFPCSTSIKPYLTYELDQVRKQQKKLPYSRNLIQFEAAVHEEAKKMKAKEEMLVKSPRDHLSNRYCGGSHTVTTPQQRIMRAGHFLTQWGPETIQLTDGLIRGKDGQMYRSRPILDKSDICGPNCWEGQFIEETELTVNVNMN